MNAPSRLLPYTSSPAETSTNATVQDGHPLRTDVSGRGDAFTETRRLAREPAIIASFSRALLEGLRADQTDQEFGAQLEAAIEQIWRASVDKNR